jgi:hypothetical protein
MIPPKPLTVYAGNGKGSATFDNVLVAYARDSRAESFVVQYDAGNYVGFMPIQLVRDVLLLGTPREIDGEHLVLASG